MGILWNCVASVLASFSGFFCSFIVAKSLGSLDFGRFAILQSTVNASSVLGGLWLGVAATKFVSQYRDLDQAKVGRIIFVSYASGVLLSVSVFVFAVLKSEYICTELLDIPELKFEFIAFSATILFTVFDGIQVGILVGFESFKSVARSGLIKAITILPTTFVLVRYFGLSGAVAGSVLNCLINFVINSFAVNRELKQRSIPVDRRLVLDEGKEFINFSLPALLGGLLGLPLVWIGNSMLANSPAGYVQVGAFMMAMQWRNAFLYLPRKMMGVALPVLSSIRNGGVHQSTSLSERVFKYSNGVSLIVLLPMLTCGLFMAKLILQAYGSGFTNAQDVFRVVLTETAIASLGIGVTPIVQSKGKMWFGLATNLLWGGVFISIVSISVRTYGALGLAGAMLVANLVNLGTLIYFLKDHLPLGVLGRNFSASMMMLSIGFLSSLIDGDIAVILAVPVSILVGFITIKLFVDREVSDSVLCILMGWLRFAGGKINEEWQRWKHWE